MLTRIQHFVAQLPLVQKLGVQLILGLIVSFACLGAFAAIAEDIIEKDKLVAVDMAFADALHEAATPTSIEIYKFITWFGLPGIWGLAFVVGIFLLARKLWLRLGVWIVALGGGILLNNVLKLIFERERPGFVNPIVVEQNFSFPSGHAMMALIGYGLLAYLLWNSLENRYARIVVVFAAALLVILIGISRMTLGAHYLSDVVAGFAAGGVWLAACVTAMHTITRRGAEPEAIKDVGAVTG